MIIAFARQGQEIGHFSKDEVPELVASGQILPSDDYWHEGMDEWRKVGDRWPVAKVAHLPTAPVMTMEDVPTLSRSGFALIFWLLAVLLIAGGAYWYLNLRPAKGEPASTAEPTIAEPSTAVAPVEDGAGIGSNFNTGASSDRRGTGVGMAARKSEVSAANRQAAAAPRVHAQAQWLGARQHDGGCCCSKRQCPFSLAAFLPLVEGIEIDS